MLKKLQDQGFVPRNFESSADNRCSESPDRKSRRSLLKQRLMTTDEKPRITLSRYMKFRKFSRTQTQVKKFKNTVTDKMSGTLFKSIQAE